MAALIERLKRALPGVAASLLLLGSSFQAEGQNPPQEPPPATTEKQPPAKPPDDAEKTVRRNVFLYVIDGLGATEVTAYGYPIMTTPNLVSMMEEGITYTNHYSVSPWTAPAVASLFTALFPSAHGVNRAGERLPAAARTFAEVLKENGYKTALFSAHPLVGPLSGLQQGFDWVEEVPGPFYPKASRGPAESSSVLNARVKQWLDASGGSAPVFVTVISADPLQPFGVPDPAGGRFIDAKELEWYRGIRKRLLERRPGPLSLATLDDLKYLKADPSRFAAAARKVYDAAIFHNDAQMRALRDDLQQRGWLGSSLFVATATHGQELLEHGAFGHGSSLYDVGIKVPLVLTCPELFARVNQVRDMADNVDLMPTLLSLLGLPVPEGVQGIVRNLSPAPDKVMPLQRPAFAEARPAGELDTGTMVMVAEEGVKFIENSQAPAGLDRSAVELYRRKEGPQDWDRKNVAGGMPRVMAHEREVLALWKERTNDKRLPADPGPVPADPRLKEVLRSLGYLQGSGSAVTPSSAGKQPAGAKAAPSAEHP
ncbi:MAG TPA: sulfatase [Candidatus Polarisedimenticolia bacterium]|nr:sulfatase [Candidatus Polarisedimenticolia bacterium]